MGAILRAGARPVLFAVIGTLFASFPIAAQIGYPGGQYPGGQYPGGPYPGGGASYPGGSPYPGGGTGYPGGRGGGGSTGPSRGSNRGPAVIPTSTTGILRLVSGDQFVFEADDHRIMTFATASTIKIDKDGKPAELSAFSPGDHLTVDSTADEKGFLTAVAVTFNSAGSARDRADAARTWDLPTLRPGSKRSSGSAPSGNRSDDDRPVLRRSGGNKTETKEEAAAPANNTPPSSSASAAPPSSAAPSAAGEPAEPVNNSPTTVVRPNDPPPDSDDPGRPALRRGMPAPRARTTVESADSQPVTSTSARTPDPLPSAEPSNAEPFIPVQEDPVIVKAREASAAYAASLPNYLTQESITRYDSDNPKRGWNALDVISADLTVENGNESHKNIKVGNRATNKPMEEVDGNWSTGQFHAMVEELFDPGTRTVFRKSGQETIRGRSALIYKFDVKREESRWRIITASQLYFPAYRGSLWIDKESSQVLRMEMESRNIPPQFPLAKVESATDYDFVRLATTRQYLLPTAAEVLSCETGSSRCARNRIEYRNYRRFGAESDITFEDKQ